jgi:hypothetical protein
MSYAIQQLPTQQVTLRTLMRRKSFVHGHRSVLRGQPLDYDAYRDTNQQWSYERGRQFALLFPHPIKSGQTVRNAAVSEYGRALRERAIL